MDSTDTVIIDLQFVVGNNKEYYIKEIAILYLGSPTEMNYILRPKFHFKKLNNQAKLQNYYNYKNINGLKWTDGTVNYHEVFKIFEKIAENLIIVRGDEKRKILQKYLPSTKIIDLEMNTSLESYKDPGVICQLHERRLNQRCASKNVFKIQQYMIENNIFMST